MSKIKVEFKEREWKKIDKWGISVKPFISDVDQRAIIRVYLQDLFSNDRDIENNYILAENGLMANILELQTDLLLVDDTTEPPTVVVPLDVIFMYYDTYLEVEKAIVNIGEFKRRLLKTVEAKREEIRIKNSIGFVLDSLYQKVSTFLDEIAINGFSEEDANRVKETLGEIEKSSVLKSLVGKV